MASCLPLHCVRRAYFDCGLICLWTDGSDAVQQRGQLHLGTLPAGPGVRAERPAQGGPSGPTAVSPADNHIHADATAPDPALTDPLFLCLYVCLFVCFLFFHIHIQSKQNRVYQGQVSNAGVCTSHALQRRRQLHRQGFKQG